MEGHEGEFVLVVTRSWESRSLGMLRRIWHVEESWYLGLITSPYLSQTESHLRVHTPKHALSEDYKGIQEWDGDIFSFVKTVIDMLEAPLKPDRRIIRNAPSPGLALEIVVGDKAVTSWFENLAHNIMIKKYDQNNLDFWKEHNPQHYEYIRSRFPNTPHLVKFKEMQNILGRETSLTPENEEKIEVEIKRQKIQLLKEIEELVEKESQYLARLAQIKGLKLPRITLGLEDAGYEKEVRQDEEDLKWLKSIPVNEGVINIRDSIRRALKKALELGLHQKPWLITQEIRPGKKIEIDAPRLIKVYCEYYEVTTHSKA